MATLLAECNVPLAFADKLSSVINEVFDCKVAKNFSSKRTKTACILNGAFAPDLKRSLVEKLRTSAFSMAMDGSNDTGVEKMNPLTVKLYDVNRSKVTNTYVCCHSAYPHGMPRLE